VLLQSLCLFCGPGDCILPPTATAAPNAAKALGTAGGLRRVSSATGASATGAGVQMRMVLIRALDSNSSRLICLVYFLVLARGASIDPVVFGILQVCVNKRVKSIA